MSRRAKLGIAIIAAAALGVPVGAGLARLALPGVWAASSETRGGWRASGAAGSEAAGPVTRAMIARFGLLALTLPEATYFSADTDGAGRALRQDCAYRVTGAAPPARWWSLTVYDEEGFLARNDDDAHSVGAWSAPGDDIAASLGGARDGPTWLSLDATGAPSLTLRLYGPDVAELADWTPPKIERAGCSA